MTQTGRAGGCAPPVALGTVAEWAAECLWSWSIGSQTARFRVESAGSAGAQAID